MFGPVIAIPRIDRRRRDGWRVPGATLHLDFRNNRSFGAALADVTATRASGGTALDLAGNVVSFAANTLRRTDRGLLIETARTNLFANSLAPATQTIAVAAGTTYTVSRGPGGGTVTLSGALTGAPTPATPVSASASGTALTVTVAGPVAWVQVEAGAFPTSIIETAGTSATRAFDVVWLPLGAWWSAGEGVFVATVRDVATGGTSAVASLVNASNASGTGTTVDGRTNPATANAQVQGGTVSASATPLPVQNRRRLAWGYRTSDNRLSVSADGTTFGTMTASDYTGVGAARLLLGARNATPAVPLNGYIEDIAFVPTPGLLAGAATMNPLTVMAGAP